MNHIASSPRLLYFYFTSQITLNLQYSRVIDTSHILVTLKINGNLWSLLESGKSINQISPINALDNSEGLFRTRYQAFWAFWNCVFVKHNSSELQPMDFNLTDFWKYFVRFLRDKSITRNFLKDRKYNSQRMKGNGPSRLPAKWTAFSVYWSGETEERTLN